jgi:hypothetical protein
VARDGDYLLLVDDELPGAYFRFALPKKAGLIDLTKVHAKLVSVPKVTLASDLESIDVLADGRIILLSERLRSIVDQDGLVAEYGPMMNEVAQRGLEGVAVRNLGAGNSMVAVLWEGGYPDPSATPAILKRPEGRASAKPEVIVHRIEANQRLGRLLHGKPTPLDVPMPEGEEPRAQRFRAPDLDWYKLPNGTWGLMVLMSSQDGGDKPVYENRWLQRFDLRGRAIGSPLDLMPLLPEPLRQANWEGLHWFEEGRSIVLAHEIARRQPPHILILELPESWQYQP